LESFTVPSSVLTLGDFIFWPCSALSSVTFERPSHLTNIPAYLFGGCDLLKSIDIPESVTTIASAAFLYSGVTSVTGADCTICDSLLIRRGTILHCFGSPSKIVIPPTVREIGDNAFNGVKSLNDLSFEEGVVSIGDYAFGHCRGLQTVAFPASLEVIGEDAFFCCKLSKITFAAGSRLECIRQDAFVDLPLETVIFPATAKDIHPGAFGQEVWPLIEFDGPPHLFMSSDFFFSADSRILVKALPWRGSVVVPSSVETIGDRC
jgi:hypothetical protein